MIGITENGIADPLPQSTGDLQFFDIGTKNYAEVSGIEIKQRNALVGAIKAKERSSNYKTAFQNVIEEVAYTWFNRLIAVRFMEVNDYLPSRVRVLSSENPAKNEPDFVTTPFDTDLEFTPYEQDRILQLKDENKLDELFRMLFIKQCNKFNEILPELFEKTDDYSELLLTISFTDKDGVVYHLVHDIAEDDFNVSKEGQVEIIGWMYQFYNTEPKEEVFAQLKKNVKITRDRIPAATQIFTPDWIVQYMVQNSLGKLWVEGHPNAETLSSCRYFLADAQQEKNTILQLQEHVGENQKLTPEDVMIIDPCMGSGHILVYSFDLLMQIYTDNGYTQRDAASSILKNNLYGLDIDDRAYQLAYFAVMMKARQYNRRIFSENITPNLCAIKESTRLGASAKEKLGNCIKLADELILLFEDAKEYGSILKINISNESLIELEEKVLQIKESSRFGNIIDFIDADEIERVLTPLIKQARLLSQKYDVVVTNPPYMNAVTNSAKLANYVTQNYPDSKYDLFSVFMEKGIQMIKPSGYSCMVTMQSWMFLSSYEKFRKKIIDCNTLTNLMHMDNMVMGIAFGTAVSVIRKFNIPEYVGTYNYVTMSDINNDEPFEFPVKKNRFSQIPSTRFISIPSSPIAYWVSQNVVDDYENGQRLGNIASPKTGMTTGDNNRFLRLWQEIDFTKVSLNSASADEAVKSNKKWFPYCKGGGFKRYYGYNEYLINWENNGFEIKNNVKENGLKAASVRSENLYFKPLITWSAVTSGKFSCRLCEGGALFDSGGSSILVVKNRLYLLGLLNSSIGQYFLDISNSTINYQPGDIANIPVLLQNVDEIENLVDECIRYAREDWDSFETSWDFSSHPLVRCASFSMKEMEEDKAHHIVDMNYVEEAFVNWSNECYLRFSKVKENEERINRYFIDIYGLQDELTPTVEDKDVTVRKADIQREIKSLISYAVGCMFGRYSLDVEGIAYAGGTWDPSKYSTFIPDTDNCIPITDEDYFDDDIVGRFVQFVKVVYGEKTLEENLDFIANALGNKGNTSREVIRNYFLNDFIKDHIKTYQKRPIYWLFDSGKQNGFKGLVYMHRWNADTVGNLRVEYLHRMQRVYEKEIERMQDTIDHTQGRDQSAAQKRKEKLVNQLKESKDYDAKIAHIALARVDIDLDDGVKVNYEKVQKGQDGKNLGILAKI